MARGYYNSVAGPVDASGVSNLGGFAQELVSQILRMQAQTDQDNLQRANVFGNLQARQRDQQIEQQRLMMEQQQRQDEYDKQRRDVQAKEEDMFLKYAAQDVNLD